MTTWAEGMVIHALVKFTDKVELRSQIQKALKPLVIYGASSERFPRALKDRVQNALKFK